MAWRRLVNMATLGAFLFTASCAPDRMPHVPEKPRPVQIINPPRDAQPEIEVENLFPYGLPPRASEDFYPSSEDALLVVSAPGVLANDFHSDLETLVAVLDSSPLQGTLDLRSDGSLRYAPFPNFSGSDSFTYRASNGGLESLPAMVLVEITSQPDNPMAEDDAYVILEDSTLSAVVSVLANDSDPDGDLLQAVLGSSPVGGGVDFRSDGTFIYIPPSDFNGTATFTYRASDGILESEPAIVNIAMLPQNDAPIAVADSFEVDEGYSFNLAAPGLLSNDGDIDGDRLTTILDSSPIYGTLDLALDGSCRYTPEPYFSGTDTFLYVANDGALSSSPVPVTLTVFPHNDFPQAVDDHFEGEEDQPLVVPLPGVLGNDTDTDSDVLAAVPFISPGLGLLDLRADGSFTYTPRSNLSGTDLFMYQASDGAVSSLATAVIRIVPINDAPLAANDEYATDQEVPLAVGSSLGVLANDSDIDSTPLSATLERLVVSGTISLNGDGSFLYVPSPGFWGRDSFTYRVSDSQGGSSIAEVGLQVNEVPEGMEASLIARVDYYSLEEGSSLDIAAPGILVNDSGPAGESFTAQLVSEPSNGTLFLNPTGAFIYAPESDFNGTDVFTYQLRHETNTSRLAPVLITVNPSNDAPLASNDAYEVVEDENLFVGSADGVLINDHDIDGDDLRASLVEGPNHGTLTLQDDGSFQYHPQENFNGSDSYTYQASDGSLSAFANVALTVLPQEDIPQPIDDLFKMDEDIPLLVSAPGVLANDENPDNNTLRAVLASGPASGTLELSADGSFRYAPLEDSNGMVSFVYKIAGGEEGMVGRGVISIRPVNDVPQAFSEPDYQVEESGVVNISAAQGVLRNDMDVDGDSLTVLLSTSPSQGLLALASDGSFRYSPYAGFRGSDEFTYRVTDGSLESREATASISITHFIPPWSWDGTLSFELGPVIHPELAGAGTARAVSLGNIFAGADLPTYLSPLSAIDGFRDVTEELGLDGISSNLVVALPFYGTAFPDIITSWRGDPVLIRNEGEGRGYTERIALEDIIIGFPDRHPVRSATTMDLDGDGLLDAVFVGEQGGEQQAFAILDQGEGQFRYEHLWTQPPTNPFGANTLTVVGSMATEEGTFLYIGGEKHSPPMEPVNGDVILQVTARDGELIVADVTSAYFYNYRFDWTVASTRGGVLGATPVTIIGTDVAFDVVYNGVDSDLNMLRPGRMTDTMGAHSLYLGGDGTRLFALSDNNWINLITADSSGDVDFWKTLHDPDPLFVGYFNPPDSPSYGSVSLSVPRVFWGGRGADFNGDGLEDLLVASTNDLANSVFGTTVTNQTPRPVLLRNTSTDEMSPQFQEQAGVGSYFSEAGRGYQGLMAFPFDPTLQGKYCVMLVPFEVPPTGWDGVMPVTDTLKVLCPEHSGPQIGIFYPRYATSMRLEFEGGRVKDVDIVLGGYGPGGGPPLDRGLFGAPEGRLERVIFKDEHERLYVADGPFFVGRYYQFNLER